MGLRWILCCLSIVFTSLHSAANDRVVYGDDDRKDYYELTDTHWQEAIDSTVALVDQVKIEPVGHNEFTLKTKHYGKTYSLCTDQPFYDQERAAFCSGTLIAPDIVMTAGHCIKSEYDCTSTKLVFDFNYKQKGLLPSTYTNEQVYSCAEIIKQVYKPRGTDFALIRLDRKVLNRSPLSLRQSGKVDTQTELVVIGHPSGLPSKYADGGFVRNNRKDSHFSANLDTFGGNSGSAVFNKDSGEIEGILVRGATDYLQGGNSCRIINHCKNDSCRGEDVTRISEVLPYIPTS